MNQTVDILSVPNICDTCQMTYGFSSAEIRSIIVMVVLVGIALILCYGGVLWYTIRTRFIPDDKLIMMSENVHTNQAYDNEEQGGDIEGNVQNMVNSTEITTSEPAVLTVENENVRF